MIQRHAQFWFFRKGLGTVSPLHFLYDFSRKMFLILYSINWPNFIVWLPLIFEILGNICIAIVCFLDRDVINSEINLIFLIKPFFHMTRKSWQKFKHLDNEKSFLGEIKSIFHHFYRAFSCQKLPQTLDRTFKNLSETCNLMWLPSLKCLATSGILGWLAGRQWAWSLWSGGSTFSQLWCF